MGCLVHGSSSIQHCNVFKGFECCACCSIGTCEERIADMDNIGKDLKARTYITLGRDRRSGKIDRMDSETTEITFLSVVLATPDLDLTKYPNIRRLLQDRRKAV